MKTLGGRYVLINSDTKKEVYLEWKEKHLNKTSGNNIINREPMKYMERKNLISQLQPLSHNQYNTNSFKNLKTLASTNKIPPFAKSDIQRQNITVKHFHHNHRQSQKQFKTIYRSRSLGKNLNRVNDVCIVKKKIDQQELRQKIQQAMNLEDGKVICILCMRRNGLRYKLSHKFMVYHRDVNHKKLVQQSKQHLFPDILNKPLYLFHLSKQPINSITKNLDSKQFIIFGDIDPKFNLSFELQMKLFEQASIFEDLIKKKYSQYIEQVQAEQDMVNSQEKAEYLGQQLRRIKYQQIMRDRTKKDVKYQWQKIGNINQYVQMLIENPQKTTMIKKDTTETDQLADWCQQKYVNVYDNLQDESSKNRQQKNPFFDVITHYPSETANKKGLEATLQKMEYHQLTKNNHDNKNQPLQNMMQKIKRQKENFERLKKQQIQKIKHLGYRSEKQFMRNLDNQKNTRLVQQNIPYIMAKYGITRAEAYNLYNLYKSLQKISAMRTIQRNQHVVVKQKGIDRQTFDEGLNTLQINPGDQVIRNICYFPQYITWEQFLKIISISLRKTTESKLEAILQGIGSSSAGQLSQHQISIMINSSLYKIFGKQQPDLRNHFVNVVMRTLDTDRSGTLDCGQLKAHVLASNPEDMDLISYLILNS